MKALSTADSIQSNSIRSNPIHAYLGGDAAVLVHDYDGVEEGQQVQLAVERHYACGAVQHGCRGTAHRLVPYLCRHLHPSHTHCIGLDWIRFASIQSIQVSGKEAYPKTIR